MPLDFDLTDDEAQTTEDRQSSTESASTDSPAPAPLVDALYQKRAAAIELLNAYFQSKALKDFRKAVKDQQVYKPEVAHVAEQFVGCLDELEEHIDPHCPTPCAFETEVPRLLIRAKETIDSVPLLAPAIRKETTDLLDCLQHLTPPTTWYRDARRASTSSQRASRGGSDGGECHDDKVALITLPPSYVPPPVISSEKCRCVLS
jgi:hypothetical protein